MNASRYESEASPTSGTATPHEAERDVPEMRAAPKREDEGDQRDEEPTEEPGYGHGV